MFKTFASHQASLLTTDGLDQKSATTYPDGLGQKFFES